MLAVVMDICSGSPMENHSGVDMPRCIASSSSPDRLALCLEVLDFNPSSAHTSSVPQLSPEGNPIPTYSFTLPDRWGWTLQRVSFLRTVRQVWRLQLPQG